MCSARGINRVEFNALSIKLAGLVIYFFNLSASHYEVYMAPSALDLMQDTSHVTNLTQDDMLHGSLLDPKPFGMREFFMLQIPPAFQAMQR